MTISPLRNYLLHSSFNATASSEQIVTRSLERLGTGLRINRASDDPAAFKLSESLRTLGSYQSMAARNANDAITMVQIADGALEGVASMLVQMKDLVTRSINGSFTNDQRKLLLERISDLRDEINATADRTTMNNLRLLQGDFSIPVSGDFREAFGEIEADQPTLQARSSVKSGVHSSLGISGASQISVRSSNTDLAPTGEYYFSTASNVVTLTRTNGTVTTSQSIALTAAAPGANQVQIPNVAGQAFTLDFNNLNVSVTYQVDSIGARSSPEDFAVLVANVGARPSTSNWQPVSGADLATGAASDQVLARVTANQGYLKLTTTTGLTPLSGYGDATSWINGSESSIGLIGTVASVNAALATLQVRSETGLGDVDISITPQFKNSVFLDSTSLDRTGTPVTVPGWNIYEERFILGSTLVSGWLSSNADNEPANPSPDYTSPVSTSVTRATYRAALSSDVPDTSAGRSLHLYSEGITVTGYGVVHGPYVVSQNAVSLAEGDTVSFKWKSEGGDDAFDSYAYLLNINNGTQLELLDVTGADARDETSWASAGLTIPSGAAGDYKFVFIAGTYDATGGTIAGGSLYLTDIQVNPRDSSSSILRAMNIGNGGLISMDNAITLTDVQLVGIGQWSAPDGIYRLVADADLKTVTLKQYDVDLDTFVRAETLNQETALGINESRTFSFSTLGVAVTLRNSANEPLWLGADKSGYETETIVAENKRIDTNVSAPTFQISDGTKFDVKINQLRDIRMGSNGDSKNAPIFNRLNHLINDLSTNSAPPIDVLQSLHLAVAEAAERVSDMRSELGSVMSRMSAAIGNISSQLQSFSSSDKRIRDTDYAMEIAHLIQLNAQRDISAATMAHVNSQPKVVLWLLDSEDSAPRSQRDLSPSKPRGNLPNAASAYRATLEKSPLHLHDA